jgi:hypothetical protein
LCIGGQLVPDLDFLELFGAAVDKLVVDLFVNNPTAGGATDLTRVQRDRPH